MRHHEVVHAEARWKIAALHDEAMRARHARPRVGADGAVVFGARARYALAVAVEWALRRLVQT